MKLLSFIGKSKHSNYSLFFVLVFILFSNLTAFAASEDKASVLKKIKQTTGREERPVRPVKNVILLIPDGCSFSTVSAARWYQWLKNPDLPGLYIDPFMCGTVRTSSSNAPIGDSAPTTSCYMTGELSRTGFVSTYPPYGGENDIFETDSTRAYQPMMTVLEAVKLLYGKSTGLVFTCEFTHATPADCSSHSYNRNDYKSISSQMVHNNLDVVIGGGVGILEKEQQKYLKDNGYQVFLNDHEGLRNFEGKKIWSLFGDRDLPFDLDRNPEKYPSLEEMTTKAINTLSQNKKGFFLMVEGSKVDWAAHDNDPVAMITEFLAFDKACKAALDFARKDGNTAVVILPDHGNSGISIGTSRLSGYDKLTKQQLFGSVLKFEKTSDGIAQLINQADHAEAGNIYKKYTHLELTELQLAKIDSAKDYVKSPIPAAERKKGPDLNVLLAKFMTDKTCFGFTTGGHTGEEVFLAAYHPKKDIPGGVLFNFEINDYICRLMDIRGKLPELTGKYFVKHTDVFKDMDCSVDTTLEDKHPVLTVRNSQKSLMLKDDSNVAVIDGKEIKLNSVVVYVDKNNTFYLPESLRKLIE